MTSKAILNELYNRDKSKFKLGLGPMKRLAKALDNPEKSLKVVHIAGTNGKGSTAAMMASILRVAGYKVGLYTSPHLRTFNERIVVNAKKITDKELVSYYKKIKKHISDQSFFEITTAMAFLHFKEKKCDLVVCEVGLGGRLDATNIVSPVLSVITPISKDHQQFLGSTLKDIAKEKAGIVKKRVPVVTNNTGVSLQVINQQAMKMNAPLILSKKTTKAKIGLKGSFQQQNAALAIAVSETLDKHSSFSISKNDVKKGLATVSQRGRFQYLSKKVLVDCAHNLEGQQTLVKELKKIPRRKVAVVSIMADKNVKEMISTLSKGVDEFVFTKAPIERAADPEELAKHCKKPFTLEPNHKKAFSLAKRKKGLVVVTGSFYLVGEFV